MRRTMPTSSAGMFAERVGADGGGAVDLQLVADGEQAEPLNRPPDGGERDEAGGEAGEIKVRDEEAAASEGCHGGGGVQDAGGILDAGEQRRGDGRPNERAGGGDEESADQQREFQRERVVNGEEGCHGRVCDPRSRNRASVSS